MNKSIPIIVVCLALIGAVAGIWGAYTTYNATKPEQSIGRHLAMQASFEKQIASVQKRGNERELLRLQKAYEDYEEGWRESLKIATLVEVAYASKPDEIDQYTKAAISLWTHNAIVRTSGWLTYNAALVGKAWFISGEYAKASRAFGLAQDHNPKNPVNYINTARALGYLAAYSSDPEEKVKYTEFAIQRAMSALTILQEKPLPILVDNDKILHSIFELAKQEGQPQSKSK